MKKKYILIMSLILVVLIILGVSYALLQKNVVGDNEKIIYQVGDLEVKLDESGSRDISLDNAIPTEDSDGMKNVPYSFSLVNNAVTDLKYTIYLEEDDAAKNKCGNDCALIPYNYVRYNLSNDSDSLKNGNLLSSSTELYTGTIESKSTDKLNLRIWLSIDADNSAMGKYYFGKLKVVLSQADDYCVRNGFTKLSDCMLVMNNHESSVETAKQNIVAKGTPDFSKTATTDEGLFMTEDDDGPSYYYRGAVKNNFVSFAGFMWRIIRQNGDGSIRMIYAGKKTNDTGIATTIGNSPYNYNNAVPNYIGYMYGADFSLHDDNLNIKYSIFTNTNTYSFGTDYVVNPSNLKFSLSGQIKQLNWKDNHDEIVDEKLYTCLGWNCYQQIYRVVDYVSNNTMLIQPVYYRSNSYNDTLSNTVNSTIKSKVDNWYATNLLQYATSISDNTFCNDRSLFSGSGYQLEGTIYSVYDRLYTKKLPSLKCSQMSDKFRMNNDIAKLDYPVGLITADETVMAGASIRTANEKYYLYNGYDYHTMSPSGFSVDYLVAVNFNLRSDGSLTPSFDVSFGYGVRPVINLQADVKIEKGDGTSISPYKIITN